MQAWNDQLKDYHGKDLAERKVWYGAIATAYDRVRPRYPAAIVDRVIELAQIPPNGKILELGCGPGIATIPFAQRGYSLLALDPNLEASQIAKENCANYPQVEIQNTSFEEWEDGGMHDRFDAVLAATSWHWIAPEVAYHKATEVLKQNGALILLWNTPPQLSYAVYQDLERIYRQFSPSIPAYARYDSVEIHIQHFEEFSRNILESGKFAKVVYDKLTCEVTYTLDDYLALLSTLSAYIAIDAETRKALFMALRSQLERQFGDRLPLSYISAFHVAKKI